MNDPLVELRSLMRETAELVARFESLAPGRSFTPDGHMVGSIGELIAEVEHKLRLEPASTKGWDAVRSEPGAIQRTVEIKATQKSSVALRHVDALCDDLLVIHLDFHAGEWSTVYYGPASPVWESLPDKTPSNGQRAISLTKLRAITAATTNGG